MELFKKIEGIDNDCLISSYGRVYSNSQKRFRKLQIDGRMRVTQFDVVGVHTRFPIHKLVAEHFLDKPSNNSKVRHINNIMSDNKVDNLKYEVA